MQTETFSDGNPRLCLQVPSRQVKTVKDALERLESLDKSVKITKTESSIGIESFVIPTLYRDSIPSHLLQELGLGEKHVAQTKRVTKSPEKTVLEKAVQQWMLDLPEECRQSLDDGVLMQDLPSAWTIYSPMLLFPSTAFESPMWLQTISICAEHANKLFEAIANAFGVTHIAKNAPIPTRHANDLEMKGSDNILRKPRDLKTLYGDFGPSASDDLPTQDDKDTTLWVSTKQNGITQVWAPLHTMFSRGNVTEKARILHLDTVNLCVQEGTLSGKGSAAVDLYAGIGYFTFSYLKAGVNKVLAWELNPWSIEGLSRGSERNGWDVLMYQHPSRFDPQTSQGSKLIAFQSDNLTASGFVRLHRESLPPIRHVNCGLLPSSKGSWKTAVKVVDPLAGGWIHIHENILVEEIEKQAALILDTIRGMVHEHHAERAAEYVVTLEHIERVKTYAPRVMHCVLDISIAPLLSQ